MKFTSILMLLLSLLMLHNAKAQYQGPVDSISSGYGAYGSDSVAVVSIPNDYWANYDIKVYYPQNLTSPAPTIYYAHGFGSYEVALQEEMLQHMASRGYAVVFVPYQASFDFSGHYLSLYSGFIKASRALPAVIDTTQVGFYGHSFGAGAAPVIAYSLFMDNNWGTNGKFMYLSAPWYSIGLTDTMLYTFPTDCNLLTVLYDDDTSNDHRMAMDIFKNIAIDTDDKDCITVFSDTISGYAYATNHAMPESSQYDALDFYATFRLIDALADYSFTGNATAKDIALGNGSAAQTDMGNLIDLMVSDDPYPVYNQSKYLYPCSDGLNERAAYCIEPLPSSTADISAEPNAVKVFPNPSNGTIFITANGNETIKEVTVISQVGSIVFSTQNVNSIDLASFESGIYSINITTNNQTTTKKVVLMH